MSGAPLLIPLPAANDPTGGAVGLRREELETAANLLTAACEVLHQAAAVVDCAKIATHDDELLGEIGDAIDAADRAATRLERELARRVL